MSKEDNYEVTAREDVTADIPVANVPEGAENALLPKKESEDDDLIVKFRKPFDFEGEIYEKLETLVEKKDVKKRLSIRREFPASCRRQQRLTRRS